MLSISRETKTCTVKLINDSIDFRTIIVKPYLKKSDTPIQDPIQDPIQGPIQDSIQCLIQDSIQGSIQDLIQSIQDSVQSENITLRRNLSRPQQRPTRFQNINMIDIIIYMFKFISPPANFQTFRLKKFNGLLEKRVFEIIHIDDLFTKTRVFESRFMNQMKNEGTEKAFEKSRLVI